MALPTHGRVIIETTVGELDIELWSKEAPKACRNFIALAMEGYYDGVIFHRVVPDFLVQTGDRTGTGGGGESFYGEPFEDEIHPRLRFAHRGLVAMANNGAKNSNDSQFFITLDRADELHGKHTLFGRCMGDTIFNVMKIGGMELDANERPLYPPKIKAIRIIENPFNDIVPRITAAEKRSQRLAREQAQKEREEEQKRRGAKKNTKLLSFQDDGDGDELGEVTFKKKSITRPDMIDNRRDLLINSELVVPTVAPAKPQNEKKDQVSEKTSSQKKSKNNADEDLSGIREKHEQAQAASQNSRQAEIEKLEREIRKLNNKRTGTPGSEEDRSKKKAKSRSNLEAELAKYEHSRGLKSKKSGKRTRDEGDVLAKLDVFMDKLKGSFMDGVDDSEHKEDEPGEESAPDLAGEVGGGEEPPLEVDNDTDFLSHTLHFPRVDGEAEFRRAEKDYEVIDPRIRGARAREEERGRKHRKRAPDGGRGSRRM